MNVQGYEGHDLPPEIKNKYAVSRKLGSGACGEVKLVFTKVGCKRFAMKIISKKGLTTMNSNPAHDPKKIMNEVEILKKLRHVSFSLHDQFKSYYVDAKILFRTSFFF